MFKKYVRSLFLGLAALLSVSLLTSNSHALLTVNEDEAYEIGIEAYLYFYPLVTMDVTRRVATNLPAGVKPGLGPINEFHHFKEFPTASFREVVRPNFDTLYSSAWLDLSEEPQVVTAPDTKGRYYLLPMIDMWTDVFAVPGKRTSGTEAQNWAVVPAGWTGKLPKGIKRIESPTPYVWIIGRTQTNGPSDYEAVHGVQRGFKVIPLSRYGKKQAPKRPAVDSNVDMNTPPLIQVTNMRASKYFSYASELMKTNPPHGTDWSQLERLKRIGIEPGKSFDYDSAPAEIKAGLERAVPAALELMRKKAPNLVRMANGWQMNTDSIGVYGNFYLKRAIVAQVGLGANPPEDSIYPLNVYDEDQQPLDSGKQYLLHFNKDEIPPVDAFWSLTLYDQQGFQVANPLNRFAIGDRDQLKFNSDGSLDIYVQHQSPGADKESNWLPAPKSGQFGLTMRLYAPKPQALDGRWNPPVVSKAK